MDELRKPPIIEAWIGLKFQVDAEGLPWTVDNARRFLANYSEQFPNADFEAEHKLNLRGGSPHELPTVVNQEVEFHKVKVHNEQRSRWVQVTRDKLIYNIVEAGTAYPGFEVLCGEAMEKFRDYVEHFHPLAVRSAAICYVDIIEVPTDDGRIEHLESYFNFVRDIPETPFGDLIGFQYQNTFACPVDPGPLTVSLAPLPMSDEGVVRFHMNWQKICEKVDSLDLDHVKGRLNTAHQYVRECFRASVTPTMWRLFEPHSQD